MGERLYLDTSAVLRALLERGMSPRVEVRLRDADHLLTSRVSLVEAARALLRLRSSGVAGEVQLADAERDLRALWQHCEIWELTREVCALAELVAPRTGLRTLDALHLATFVLARRHVEGLQMLTTDERLAEATRGETG